MEGFLLLVQDNNIWFKIGNNQTGREGAACRCLVSLNINKAGKLASVQTLLNIVQDVVMPVSEAALLQTCLTAI